MNEPIQPGLYVDMPFDTYLAAEALDFSLAKWALVSPLDCWARSWLNPNRVDTETKAMVNGRAMHCRIVEGAEHFSQQYVAELDPADYPQAVRTVEDAKEQCRRLDLKVSGLRDELLDRLRPHDDVQIWDDMLEAHRDSNPGAEFLPSSQMHEIQLAAAMVENHPQLWKCFQGGKPEVSCFWRDEETGLLLKCRIDYLKPAAICEYKSFSNPLGKPVERAIYGHIAARRYHVQAAFQKIGLAQVYRSNETVGRQFVWIFQQNDGVPLARGIVFGEGSLYTAAVAQMRDAVNIFAANLERFGDAPWVDDTPIEQLDDLMVPIYATEG